MVALLSLLLGAAAGAVFWIFVQAVSLGTSVIWEEIPSYTGFRWAAVPICAIGGCALGLLHRRYGNYPDDLETVLGKIRSEKRYDYRNISVIIACAVIPLILGASVGPEAGLAGITAALCYWVGDNTRFARSSASLCSELGEAVMLGQLFHMPLFGIFAVEETPSDGDAPRLPRSGKLVLYGLSAGAGILTVWGLNHLLGTSLEGFPCFPDVFISAADYAMVLLYVPAGLVLYLFYRASERIAGAGAEKVPSVWKETLCGIAVGIMCVLVPMAMFSGEDQLAELIDGYGSYSPWILIGVCLLKIPMTAFCIRFGLKGGHFFPLIFACSCMGVGISMLAFADPYSHAAFAAGVITAATLGAQLKKPFAATVLMLLCFPVRMIVWLFIAAAAGGYLAKLLDKRMRPETPASGSSAEDA